MTLEPLLETGVLANHSSDFSLTDSQPAGHTDLFMEVIPQHGQSGNHAMLTLMAIILVYSWLCCAHGCFYTCTVHLYTLTVTVQLSCWPIRASNPSRGHHTHTHTWHTHTRHRQSQMLSSGSPTKNQTLILLVWINSKTNITLREFGTCYLNVQVYRVV